MKKLLAIMIVSSIGLAANAQLFYVQGGVNLANITKNNEGQTEDNNMLTTFNAGVMGRFGISKIIDLETGLLLTGRGAKAETYFNGGSDYVKAKFNPLYVELPLNVVVNVPLEGNTKLFFTGGPYAAMGVGGKSKLQTKIGLIESSSEEDIKFNDDDPTTSQQEDAAYNKLKRFDYGLNVGAGFDLGKVLLKANYGFGLAKINSTESNNSDNDKNKYRTISISVGIPLGR
ncbi:MAG: porin family protein [Ferruginibacter sp.]